MLDACSLQLHCCIEAGEQVIISKALKQNELIPSNYQLLWQKLSVYSDYMLSFSLLEYYPKIVKFKDLRYQKKTKCTFCVCFPSKFLHHTVLTLLTWKKNKQTGRCSLRDDKWLCTFYLKLRSSAQRTGNGCINAIFNLEWTHSHGCIYGYACIWLIYSKKNRVSISFPLVT